VTPPDRDDSLDEIRDGLRAQLEVLKLTHAEGVPAPEGGVAVRTEAGDPAPVVPEAPAKQDPAVQHESAAAPVLIDIAEQEAELSKIRAEIGDCARCKLSEKRRSIVFGQGSAGAELVFVGEGPGEEEDRQGLAFVGKAGELLTKMIGAMGYTRDDVYICNIVKCRPPRNRDPEPDEVAACEPFLKAQLVVIRPQVIVALGRVAAHTLLGVNTPISKMRGQWTSYEGIPLMPTFHPAYLLRNAGGKRAAWDDLKQVMRRLGRAPVAQAR